MADATNKMDVVVETSPSDITQQFQLHTKIYDEMNDRRERLVKRSRDITIGSKRLIFTLHRFAWAISRIWDQAPAEISKQTNAALEKIRVDITAIQSELVGQPYWKYEPAFTPGMQEYIEAVSFLEYLVSGELLSLEKANAQLQQNTSSSFSVSMKDWLLGIADLSGELMRLAVTAASKDPNRTKAIREFLRTLLNLFSIVPESYEIKDFKSKLQVMQQSVQKVDDVCFKLVVRRSELPDAALPTESLDE